MGDSNRRARLPLIPLEGGPMLIWCEPMRRGETIKMST